MAGDDILFEERGPLGLVTLNRPKALNALTHGMALALERRLDAWRDDDRIAVVAIRGTGERAFCAGGDIRALYRAPPEKAYPFFADEYRLNWKIRTYRKPYVALIDGIVMGGGVGVSIHGSLRFSTERTVFAMPETGIGLFPDVGGTFFLPRLPEETGLWIGLTGTRLKGHDVRRAAVTDAMLPSALIDHAVALMANGDAALLDALTAAVDPESRARSAERAQARILETAPAGEAIPAEGASVIPRDFAPWRGDSLDAILEALAEGDEQARRDRETVLAKSPTSTKLAFRQIRTGRTLAFEDAMRLEYRLARFCVDGHDFHEGIRATVIDKDGTPRWQPPGLDQVDDAVIDRAFAPLPEGEELVLE